MSKFNDFDRRSLQKRRRDLEKDEQKLKIPCSHTSRKGKFRFKFNMNDPDARVECFECGTKFSMNEISYKELKHACSVLHNALNQIKVFSNHPEDDMDTIIRLGKLDYGIEEIVDLYNRTLGEYSKGAREGKRSKGYDTFGSYGTAGLGFNKKKNRY